MARPTPSQALWEARQIAEKHGMYITQCKPRGRETKEVFVLYRKAPHGSHERNQRLGKRSDVYDMLDWVRKFEPATTDQHAPAHA